MKFQALVAILIELEKTRSRNLMTELLATFLETVPAEEMSRALYLLLGQLGPAYQRVDFGLADTMVVRALARLFEVDLSEIKKTYGRLGDLGEVVTELSGEEEGEGLSLKETYEALSAVAAASGKGSQEEKVELLVGLLKRLSAIERKYVIRTVLGKMRLGFSDKTLLDALTVMESGSKAGREKLERAYQIYPDIGTIAALCKSNGLNGVEQKVGITVGVPVMSALAQRLKSADEMVAKMKRVIVEPKYDGQRIQIHFERTDKGELIRSFSRGLEENSFMFPELAQAIEQIGVKSIILDAEAVGYDPETGKLLPFQETITRKRKHGVADASKQVPIRFFCFDVLYIDGESLLQLPLWQRRERLEQVIAKGDYLQISPMIETTSADEVREFHAKQLGLGLEGAMVKKYDGVYQPGRSGWNWVKFKEVEEAKGKLSDTIDAVVMGYYRGKGKRSSFGVGAFLVGVLNPEKQEFVTVAKIGTGLTDEQWRELKRRADALFVDEPPAEFVVPDSLIPGVWMEPSLVVEIAADEITRSPLHSSGYGLRFPRLVRFRDDKKAASATTLAELQEIN